MEKCFTCKKDLTEEEIKNWNNVGESHGELNYAGLCKSCDISMPAQSFHTILKVKAD